MKHVIFLFITIGSSLFNLSSACSSIVIKNEESIFLAKNFDWTYGDGYVIKNLRGIQKSAFYTSAGNPVKWISKYGSVTFNQNGKEMPYGGINEAGLAVEMLWLDYTEYYNVSTTPYLNELEWIQYQLDNYQEVDQVIANLKQISIKPFKGKIHFIVADATGKSVVIEHIAGNVTYELKQVNQCQTITNYDIKSSANWFSNKENASKGNVTNALFRYSLLQSEIDKNSFVKDLSAKKAFELLEKVTIPKGEFKTYWTIVYDLKNRQVHFKTWDEKNTKFIDLYSLDFDKVTQAIVINTKEKGDVSKLLKEYSMSINTTLISKSFTQLALENLNFSEISDYQFNFTPNTDNSYIKNYAVLKINVSMDDGAKIGRLGIIIADSDINLKNFKPFRDALHQVLMYNSRYSWVYYGLPKGNYAVAAAQDLNNNRKPDFATEKYAFSNGARVKGEQIPSFDECKIQVENSTNEVQLILKSQ